MAWMVAARIAHVAACHRLAKDPATNIVHICHTELQQRILLAKPGASNHCLVDLCLLLLVCRHARPKHVFLRHTWGCTRDIYNTVRSKFQSLAANGGGSGTDIGLQPEAILAPRRSEMRK